MSIWDSLQDTVDQFKQGFGSVVDSTDLGTRAMFTPMNEDVARFGKWVNDSGFGKTMEQIAQTPGTDVLMPGLPMMGATWKSTNKFLKNLSPEHYKNLTPTDKTALEALTSSYPSVERAALIKGPDDYYMSEMGKGLFQHLRGENPGKIGLTEPFNYSLGPIERRLSGPPIAYAHEAGHAFTGGSGDLASWGKLDRPVSQAGAEGFTEGFSHALLNKYNKDVLAPYWWEFKGAQEPIKKAYLDAGYYGVDLANELRQGKIPNQQNAILDLLYLLRRRM